MNFTKEEIEALMKYLGGGAVINLTDCQIVLGDNAKLGDICEKEHAHASTAPDFQAVDPKFKTEKAKAIFRKLEEMDISIQKTLLMFGAYLRQSMVIWSILFQIFWILSILHPIVFCGRYLEAFFLMLRAWRKRRR